MPHGDLWVGKVAMMGSIGLWVKLDLYSKSPVGFSACGIVMRGDLKNSFLLLL